MEDSESGPNAVELIRSQSIPQERLCFICLDGSETAGDGGSKLVSCCSRCYAVTHPLCWTEWRGSQAHHARRSRLAGTRVNSDPFLCSICKSGSARIEGERVSVRWLEAFANFATQSGSHQVRFASGLFSALTGARDEARGGRVRIADADDEDDDDEEDFLDFMEAEHEANDPSFFCGNSRKFFVLNLLMILLFIIFDMVLDQLGIVETSYIVMASVLTAIAYIVVLSSYVMIRYQRIVNQRRIGG